MKTPLGKLLLVMSASWIIAQILGLLGAIGTTLSFFISLIIGYVAFRRAPSASLSGVQYNKLTEPMLEVPQTTVLPLSEYAFCEDCGKRIPLGVSYCLHCGDKQGVA